MNIIKLQDDLKNLSDQQLMGEMKNPSGQAPQFLVLSELKRRKDLRDGFQQRMTQQPQGSLADEIPAKLMQQNMMAMGGNPMMAGRGNMPPPPQRPMPQQAAPQGPMSQGFASGGLVALANGGPVGYAEGGLASLSDEDSSKYWDRIIFSGGESNGEVFPYSVTTRQLESDPEELTVETYKRYKANDKNRDRVRRNVDTINRQPRHAYAQGGLVALANGGYLPPPLTDTGDFIPGGANDLENRRLMEEYIRLKTNPSQADIRKYGAPQGAMKELMKQMHSPYDSALNYYGEQRKNLDPSERFNYHTGLGTDYGATIGALHGERDSWLEKKLGEYKPQQSKSVSNTAAKTDAEKKSSETERFTKLDQPVSAPTVPGPTGQTGAGASARVGVRGPLGSGINYGKAEQGARSLMDAFGEMPRTELTTPEEDYTKRSAFMSGPFNTYEGEFNKYMEKAQGDMDANKAANRNWLLAELGMKLLNSNSGRKGFGGAMAELGQAGSETIPKVLAMRQAEMAQQQAMDKERLGMAGKRADFETGQRGSSWDAAEKSKDARLKEDQTKWSTGVGLARDMVAQQVELEKTMIAARAAVESAKAGGFDAKTLTALYNARAKLATDLKNHQFVKGDPNSERMVAQANAQITMLNNLIAAITGVPPESINNPQEGLSWKPKGQ